MGAAPPPPPDLFLDNVLRFGADSLPAGVQTCSLFGST